MTFTRTGDAWLPSTTPDAPVRLFCLPYAGGGASVYRPWAPRLPSPLQLCPVQLPGREERLAEPPFRRVSTLVPELARRLAPYLDRPYALFGHSMGALIAFELTRHLRASGRRLPMRLFVSAHRAPSVPDGARALHALDDRGLVGELKRWAGTPDEVLAHEELMALMLPLLRADFELCETYRHAPDAPLDVPVTVMGGQEDGEVPVASLEAWRRESTAVVTLRTFAGGHFYLRTNTAALITAIGEDLEMTPPTRADCA